MSDTAQHWPDVRIEDVDDAERAALLRQAGPAGEQARVQWQQYQESQQRTASPDPSSVRDELERLWHAPTAAPAGPPVVEGEDEGEDEDDEPDEVSDVEIVADDDAPDPERAEAERKAAALGLEVRDWGEDAWRVYDPKTGKLVAKSRLDEAQV